MNKSHLASNNFQWLICHKTKQTIPIIAITPRSTLVFLCTVEEFFCDAP